MSDRDYDQVSIFAILFLVGALGWWLGWFKKDEWTAFVYPDASNLDRHFIAGKYPSFEDCQQAAIDALRAIPGAATGGDYECGNRCDSEKYGMKVCKETRK